MVWGNRLSFAEGKGGLLRKCQSGGEKRKKVSVCYSPERAVILVLRKRERIVSGVSDEGGGGKKLLLTGRTLFRSISRRRAAIGEAGMEEDRALKREIRKRSSEWGRGNSASKVWMKGRKSALVKLRRGKEGLQREERKQIQSRPKEREEHRA